LCFFTATAQAQTDFSKVQMKATRVAGNVYMLEGAGGNIGVSVGDVETIYRSLTAKQ
jgi:cyclase